MIPTRLKHLARLAVLMLGVAAAGCGEAPAEAIRFGLASAPVTLDPRFATDATSARVNRLLYERLVDFDKRYRPVPALADWTRVSPAHYRFTLREADRRFHDGTRLTAADVQATYRSVLDPETGSPHRGTLDLIERVAIDEPDTVHFYLTEPDPLFPGYLVLGILPAEGVGAGHDFQRAPVGSGPFELEAWPEEGRLRLVRRGDGQVFEFLRVSDPTVRVLKLLRGEIDMLQNDLPPELVAYLEGREEIRVVRAPGSNFTYLGFNLRDGVTGELAVRRAIAHALDREAIIEHVMGGLARPAHALLPPSHWAGAPELTGYDHDPAHARELLARAGYPPGRRPKVTYKTSSDPFRVRLATIIQRQLEEVGIEVGIRSYDWGTFYGDIKAGRFQMYSLSWVGIKTPDIFRYVFHSEAVPPKGANRGHFSSAAADRLIEAAGRAGDLETRARYYRALQVLLLERLPYVPLWYENHVYVTRRGLRGYHIARDGNYDGLMDVERVTAAR